jgi:hypothetical protein
MVLEIQVLALDRHKLFISVNKYTFTAYKIEEFADTKGIIRSRKSKTDSQHNDQ